MKCINKLAQMQWKRGENGVSGTAVIRTNCQFGANCYYVSSQSGRPYPLTFFSILLFLFYKSISLTTRAVVGRQNAFRRFGRIGKASTIGIEISPTPPLIFTGRDQKGTIFASFSTSLKFEPPAFENAAGYPNAETNFLCRNDRPRSSPSLVSWVHAPLRTVGQKYSNPHNCTAKTC